MKNKKKPTQKYIHLSWEKKSKIISCGNSKMSHSFFKLNISEIALVYKSAKKKLNK